MKCACYEKDRDQNQPSVLLVFIALKETRCPHVNGTVVHLQNNSDEQNVYTAAEQASSVASLLSPNILIPKYNFGL
jgi:hypothetical protein